MLTPASSGDTDRAEAGPMPMPMPMSRRLAVLGSFLAAMALLASIVAAPASADAVDDAVAALRGSDSRLYVDPDSSLDLADPAAIEAALPADVQVALLPERDGGAAAVERIADRLGGGSITVAVVSGTRIYAESGKYCAGYADAQARAAAQANRGDLDGVLLDFASRVATGPLAGSAQCSGDGGDTGGSGAPGPSGDRTGSESEGGGPSAMVVLGVLIVLGILGYGAVALMRRRRGARELRLASAQVQPLYSRLANEVNTIEPGDDETARQAMSDAYERFTAAGSQMESADTVETYAIARQTCIEGLMAARTARTALGLPPGPPIPPLSQTGAPHLAAPQTVTVQGNEYQGYPEYTPGAPYYFGGGRGVPGGWYSVPFWETLLIGSMLSGGLGWGWGGGGFGAGYDSGFEQGYEEGQGADSAGDAGGSTVDGVGDWAGAGDWGDGGDWAGGGDWGSGGDFGGGDFGGGDWGSGGDFGGGDFGGGDFGGD
jgi:hypothetical protein